MPLDNQFYENQLKTLNVLVVDDEKTSLLIMETHLSKLFNKVYTAKNGVEALEVLAKVEIPLVITDINMPVMDGLSLVQNIYENYPHVHIVMLSSESDSNVILGTINLGVDGYILKPITEKNVSQTITRVGKVIVNEIQQERFAKELSELNKNLQNKIEELEESNKRYERMLRRFNIRITQEFKQSKKNEEQKDAIKHDLEKIEQEHLDELAEIEHEIDCFANLFILNKITSNSMKELKDIGNKLFKYQAVIKKYPYHIALSDTITLLAQTLIGCEEQVNMTNIQNSGPYFDSLFFMLYRFREDILAKLPNVKEPNIYDASMIADIEQIIMLLKGEDRDVEEIEFF